MPEIRLFAFATITILASIGCGLSPAEHLLDPIATPWSGADDRCSDAPGAASPLVVSWAAAERGSLERRLGSGLVIVRHHGCAIEVLRHCSLPEAGYRYGMFTAKREEVRMRNADELYANLPAGAAQLEGELRRSGALTVTMRLVGMYEADRGAVHLDELAGDCGSATHVVTGVQVGAYTLEAESTAGVGAGVGLRGGPKLGGRSEAHRQVLTHDGEPTACEAARVGDAAPPDGCGTPLRLELVPLGERRDVTSTCPADMHWTGYQCESEALAADVGCPTGTTRIHGATSSVDFCLDRTEVTVAAYAECVREGGCSGTGADAWWPGIDADDAALATSACNGERPDRAAHPMNCVTWSQAAAYCRHRDARLPDDDEWAWAAAGGVQARDYPWGDAPISAAHANACGVECRAWFERRGRRRRMLAHGGDDGWPTTAEVGRFPAGRGRWGSLDLAGNVAEWTTGAASRGRRRVRGGSFWDQRPGWLRADDTSAAIEDRRDPGIGYRCATQTSDRIPWDDG
jgi:hypothetical protein